MFKKGTQKQILYDYLLTGKSITTKTAITELGFADLQGVIRNLKNAGISIRTVNKKVSTRYTKADGSPKYAYVKEYSLGQQEDDCEIWTFRTAEEQAEWEDFCENTPIQESTKNYLKSKHRHTVKGTRIDDDRDVSTLQDWLHKNRE